MANEWLPLPLKFADAVAVDKGKRVVYADQRFSADPLLLTWVARMEHEGIIVSIVAESVDQIAAMRLRGMRLFESADITAENKADAVELITKAAAYRAADMHVMMKGTHAEIQIGVNGGLRVLDRRTNEEGQNLVRAIYQGLAKIRESGYNILDCQDAQIPGDSLPPELNISSIRIVRGPSYPQAQGGEFMTLRIQYGSIQVERTRVELPKLELPRRPEGQLLLPKMGYTKSNIEKLSRLMDAPNGINIFTGPTGHGKTTSLYEILKHVARTTPDRRLVTIEQPVEYPMEWGVQLGVTGARTEAEASAAFAEYLRVALRMAPNILSIGELREAGVAVTAVEAAVTGHQVWTTMHLSDPFQFVERLELFDGQRLARRVFCDHKIVRGVVAQRLLPKLCPHCSVLFRNNRSLLSPHITHALSTWHDMNNLRLRGEGCKVCNFDGTTTRFAVAEVVVMDAAVMSDFIKYNSEVARDNYRAREDSDPSMLVAALQHAFRGNVDPRDVIKYVDVIEPREGVQRVALAA